MPTYKHETENENYAQLAAGSVLHGYPGHAAFPARLAAEILMRCVEHLASQSVPGPYVVYDPCCGAALHLATMAFLRWDHIDAILASDIDRKALEFARKNLSLLTLEGMEQRIAQITALIEKHNKNSHKQALTHARELRDTLHSRIAVHPIRTHLFRADATQPLPLSSKAAPGPIDILFADIPYGRHATWQTPRDPRAQAVHAPHHQMLTALHAVLPNHAILAIASGNRQKINHPAYNRLKQIRAGKRRITLLSPKLP